MIGPENKHSNLRPLLTGAVAILVITFLSAQTTSAQVVQIPTISFFNVNTTVSVPDGGYSHLGGISGSQSGSISRGVPGLSHLPIANRGFRNHAIGNQSMARNAGISVNIISLKEQEAEVMAEANRRQALRRREFNPNGSAETQSRAAFINRHIGRKKR